MATAWWSFTGNELGGDFDLGEQEQEQQDPWPSTEPKQP